MRYITDLHIHSRYSRACSKHLSVPNLAAWAAAKGIDILGTGDFTHPAWRAHLQENLEPAEEGLFRLRAGIAESSADGYVRAPRTAGARPVRFLLTGEISCIYKKNGRTRRLHLLVLVPSFAAADRLVRRLENEEFNLRSDGRPILGLDAKELLRYALEADSDCLVIPAHAWTPWYSVFGSESGFDSLEECFEDLTPHIHAIETGLSSDPPMNWRLSALDDVVLVSNSDAHGVRNLGREANVFDLETPSYAAIVDILRKGDRKRFLHTIEFFPEEGKYHVDGHRACDFRCEPERTEKLRGLCPKCGKELVRGVLGRVHALADRPTGGPRPKNAVPFKSLVPLEEVVGNALGVGRISKKVFASYAKLLGRVGPEFDVLLDASLNEIELASSERIAEAVERMRTGRLNITPGYDGIFGTVKIFEEKGTSQGKLEL